MSAEVTNLGNAIFILIICGFAIWGFLALVIAKHGWKVRWPKFAGNKPPANPKTAQKPPATRLTPPAPAVARKGPVKRERSPWSRLWGPVLLVLLVWGGFEYLLANVAVGLPYKAANWLLAGQFSSTIPVPGTGQRLVVVPESSGSSASAEGSSTRTPVELPGMYDCNGDSRVIASLGPGGSAVVDQPEGNLISWSPPIAGLITSICDQGLSACRVTNNAGYSVNLSCTYVTAPATPPASTDSSDASSTENSG